MDTRQMADRIGLDQGFIGEPYNPHRLYASWRDAELDIKLGLVYGYKIEVSLGYDTWGHYDGTILTAMTKQADLEKRK